MCVPSAMSPAQLAPTTRIIRASRASLARIAAEGGKLSAAEADRLIRAWVATEESDPNAATERNPVIRG